MAEDPQARIAALRQEIDRVDSELLALLQARAAVVAEVWALKRAHGLPLHDPAREREILERLVRQAAGSGLEPAVVERVFRAVLGVASEGGRRR